MGNSILFLAANTTRSKYYSQAMIENNIFPDMAILMGIQDKEKIFARHYSLKKSTYKNVRLFNDAISLVDTCKKLTQNLFILSEKTSNTDTVRDLIKKSKASLIIYSGFPGEIVKSSLLDLNIPFLHMHPGLLPQYRGSTTVYYSILKEKSCGVSAIILNKGIDTGRIIKQKTYPAPPESIDIDTVYDPAIRTDLLIDVLKEYKRLGEEALLGNTQDSTVGQTYYIIHPLLKHLAIKKCCK